MQLQLHICHPQKYIFFAHLHSTNKTYSTTIPPGVQNNKLPFSATGNIFQEGISTSLPDASLSKYPKIAVSYSLFAIVCSSSREQDDRFFVQFLLCFRNSSCGYLGRELFPNSICILLYTYIHNLLQMENTNLLHIPHLYSINFVPSPLQIFSSIPLHIFQCIAFDFSILLQCVLFYRFCFPFLVDNGSNSKSNRKIV